MNCNPNLISSVPASCHMMIKTPNHYNVLATKRGLLHVSSSLPCVIFIVESAANKRIPWVSPWVASWEFLMVVKVLFWLWLCTAGTSPPCNPLPFLKCSVLKATTEACGKTNLDRLQEQNWTKPSSWLNCPSSVTAMPLFSALHTTFPLRKLLPSGYFEHGWMQIVKGETGFCFCLADYFCFIPHLRQKNIQGVSICLLFVHNALWYKIVFSSLIYSICTSSRDDLTAATWTFMTAELRYHHSLS